MSDEKEIIEILENLVVDKYIDERKLEEKDIEAIINIIVLYRQEKEKNKELSDKLTEKICKGVEEEILEEYRQTIISKDKEIEELKDMNERQQYRIELVSEDEIEERGDSIDESTMLKQIKNKLDEKNIPIETLLAEFERLEDIEDKKVQIEYNNVFNKGVKSVEDKIKAKIEELDYNDIGNFERRCKQEVLQSLLEKE